MSWDYLNSENEEVKKAFSRISETEKALRKAIDNYRPSVMKERYLTGEEVCAYLHISPRTLQNLRDTQQIPFTVIGGRNIIYPESGIRETLLDNMRHIEEPFSCKKVWLTQKIDERSRSSMATVRKFRIVQTEVPG